MSNRSDWLAQPGRLSPDGRLHLHHGPIDLLIGAAGDAREQALAQAEKRFQTVLAGLVAELSLLRAPYRAGVEASDPVGRRMIDAVRPFAETFVTPMAAVAGAVADEVLAAVTRGVELAKAHVNNGGDVALHLAPGQSVVAAMGETAGRTAQIRHGDGIGGVATSGWRGRSHSLGIADSVTVLAETAATADVAATLIANAVDLPGHEAVQRRPARSLTPDSDLVDRLVTVAVGALQPGEVAAALQNGASCAQGMIDRGVISAAFLSLSDQHRAVQAEGRRLIG